MKTGTLGMSKLSGSSRLARGLVSIACGALLGSVLVIGPARATPARGVVGEPLAAGSLAEPARLKLKTDDDGFGSGSAIAQVLTIKYTIEPGGYFGWHRHGGIVWVVVATGTLTLYDGDDTTCTGQPQPAGRGFIDLGDHLHNARNDGAVPVVVYATFLLQPGGQPRIDASDPMVCGF